MTRPTPLHRTPGGALLVTVELDGSDPKTIVLSNTNRVTTVWCNPTNGDTIQIRYRVSPDAPWVTKGSYTAYGEDVLDGPVYELEFQRTAGSGTTSTCGVA